MGKPILASFKDELKFTAKPGDWTCLFSQDPGGGDYGLLVLLKVSVNRAQAPEAVTPIQPRPGPEPVRTVGGGDDIRVGVVVEMTDEGRKVARPTPDDPIYYTPVVLGYREMGGILDFWQRSPPAPTDVEHALVQALAAQGYRVAPSKAQASVVLVFRWGVVDPETHPYFESKDNKIDRIEPVNESELLALVVGQPWYSIYPTYDPNARELMADLHDKNASRYFLIVSALDARAFAARKQVLLWRAHVTTPYWGHYLDQVLGTMITTAAPLFGRETGQPRLITASAAPLN